MTSEAITGDPLGNNGAVSYPNYDSVGNRLQRTSTVSAISAATYSYDNNDRLTTDKYDLNGNTISSVGISSSYDFENRMTHWGAVTTVYDGEGNRVSETVGSTTTNYLVDSLNPTGLPQVVDETVNGSVTRTYAYGLQRIDENQLVNGNWTPSFYGYDGHWNVRFLTNTSGSVTDKDDFDAFGNQIASSGTTPSGYLFSGERFDSSLNLYHLRARYYNPATGRFLTMDPWQHKTCCGSGSCSSWTTNVYAYADDNPVNLTDPTGRAAVLEDATDLRVAILTAATAAYLGYRLSGIGRQAKCWNIGQIVVPELDKIWKLCAYLCDDDTFYVTVGRRGEPCEPFEYKN